MNTPWTPDEDAKLEALIPKMHAPEIAKELKRTPRAVHNRVRRLKKRLRDNHGPRENARRDALLKALAEGPSTTAELAVTAGTTVKRAFAALQKLERRGLVKRTPMPTGNRSRLHLWSTPE